MVKFDFLKEEKNKSERGKECVAAVSQKEDRKRQNEMYYSSPIGESTGLVSSDAPTMSSWILSP